MYLSTMAEIMSQTSKVLIDSDSRNNMFYLPLDKAMKSSGSSTDARDLAPVVGASQQAEGSSSSGGSSSDSSGTSGSSSSGASSSGSNSAPCTSGRDSLFASPYSRYEALLLPCNVYFLPL